MTLRAEISRLRRLLGGVIATHPYRLVVDTVVDPADLAAVAAGPPAAATPLQR